MRVQKILGEDFMSGIRRYRTLLNSKTALAEGYNAPFSRHAKVLKLAFNPLFQIRGAR